MDVARAYCELCREIPTLRLVIAPRHVERRSSIVLLLEGLGLSVSLRSKEAVSPADVLLLDTTGELASWYPLATCVFVGKSLPSSVNRGGQNMIEPLQAGKPVLIGPHTANFEPLASHLVESGAALRVSDIASITAAFHKLHKNHTLREQTVASAEMVLKPHQGATVRTCEFVEKLLLRPLPEKSGGE